MLLTIRHGERADLVTPKPPIKISFDAQLTQTGKKQASQTGAYLKTFIHDRIKDPIIYLYSSPFLRVLQTSARIYKELDGKVEGGAVRISNAICEHLSAQYYDEHPISKINSSIEPDAFLSQEMEGVPFTREFQQEFGTPAFPETELDKLFARFAVSFSAFEKKHFGKGVPEGAEEFKIDPEVRKRTVVILVSHGASIESWADYFKDKEFSGDWPYCSISAVELSEGEWKHLKSADDSHLK